jgi:hypothetical protein
MVPFLLGLAVGALILVVGKATLGPRHRNYWLENWLDN